jgi:hypothetical protein
MSQSESQQQEEVVHKQRKEEETAIILRRFDDCPRFKASVWVKPYVWIRISLSSLCASYAGA